MKGSKSFRILSILGVLVVFLVGQGFSIFAKSNLYWPFNPIGPYSSPREDFLAESQNMVLVTSGGEIDIVLIEGIKYGVLRRWYRNLAHPPSEAAREKFLSRLFNYVSEYYEGNDLVGIRLYDLRWDLSEGAITESTLVAEYLQP